MDKPKGAKPGLGAYKAPVTARKKDKEELSPRRVPSEQLLT